MHKRRYTKRELEALIQIEAEYGTITYQNPVLIEQLFFERTGIWRASGPLYMASQRIKRGEYDEVLYGMSTTLPLFTNDSLFTSTTGGPNGY